MNEKGAQKVPILSPNTLMSCFATHDDTIKEKIESELIYLRQHSSGRKSHKANIGSNGGITLKNYMNFKTKGLKGSVYAKNNSNKLCVRSDRGFSLNKIAPKKYKELFHPSKKLKIKNKDTCSNTHSISIETQFNKHASLYECNTQQVSAIKVPSQLISDKKGYQCILKDSSSIETQK